MQEDTIGVLAILIVVGLVALVIYVHISRSQKLLRRWADENGYELLNVEHRMFRKGPFVWSSRGQTVYRVEVRDKGGIVRKGWVRCGSWWAGVFSDKVEARWDEI
ncbi:MAG: hypothetical protein JXA93_03470 [Anaerolineae bacterium]|nr:hypothetical protein [Anaerolineae bacterium]